MRKLVERAKKEVTIDEITNNSLVGIVWKEEGKSIVIHSKNGYTSMSRALNISSNWHKNSIKEYVEESLTVSSGATEVFVFDSVGEMFDWMAK